MDEYVFSIQISFIPLKRIISIYGIESVDNYGNNYILMLRSIMTRAEYVLGKKTHYKFTHKKILLYGVQTNYYIYMHNIKLLHFV